MIEDLPKQDLTIAREPGGGTGTMASWDTNCIKAILNWRELLVQLTCGNRLQRTSIETFGVQCRYTMWLMQTMKNSQLIHNGCMKLIILYFMWQEKKRVGGFHSTKLIREHTVIVQSFHNSVWKFLAFCRFQDISGKKVTGTEQNRTFLLLSRFPNLDPTSFEG